MRRMVWKTALAVLVGISPVVAQAQFGGESNPFEEFRGNSFARPKAEAKTDKKLKNYGERLFGTQNQGVQAADFAGDKTSAGRVTPTSATANENTERTSRVSLPAPTNRRSTLRQPSQSLFKQQPSLTDSIATKPAEETGSIRPTKMASAAPVDLTTEWKTDGPFNVGQECQCSLVVTNAGQGTASDVKVETHFPTSARLVNATPQPTTAASFLTWDLGTLAAGASKTIDITLVPSTRGAFAPTAHVRHTETSVAAFQVLQPMLQVKVAGPNEVLAGDPASQVVTISNPGTGIATNVVLEAIIPKGLEHARGGKLRTELGNINPGETRSVRLALAAVAGGEHVLQLGAKADAGLAEASTAKVNVIAPSLAATVDGPGLRYLNRDAKYTVTLTNDGAASTDNVRVMHKLPAGFEYVTSTRGAKYDAQNRMVTWFVGRLDRGQSVNLDLTLNATKAGEFTHLVRATSDQGIVSDCQVSTRVEGVSALAVSVADLDDPVEVGREAAYEVTIKNEGSAPAKNVTLACELPTGTAFKSAKGPSRHNEAAGKVLFQPIARIAPGQTVTYQVITRGKNAGSKLFKAMISSDSVESIRTEESTRFYGE